MTDDAGTGMGNTDCDAIVIGGESSYYGEALKALRAAGLEPVPRGCA